MYLEQTLIQRHALMIQTMRAISCFLDIICEWETIVVLSYPAFAATGRLIHSYLRYADEKFHSRRATIERGVLYANLTHVVIARAEERIGNDSRRVLMCSGGSGRVPGSTRMQTPRQAREKTPHEVKGRTIEQKVSPLLLRWQV